MPQLRRTNITDDGIFWPDPARGPWYVVAHWSEIDGRPECVGLEVWKGVFPAENDDRDNLVVVKGRRPEGIKSTDLRTIPLASVLDALWELQRRQEAKANELSAQAVADIAAGKVKTKGDPAKVLATAGQILAQPDVYAPKRRKSGADREHFAEVAAVYADAAKSPRPRPTEAVKNHFKVSHSTATKWVAQARRLGLLPATTPGRPSSATTKKKAR
ncbi:MAG: hypothetical protein M3Q48_14665 [Actinomycetota bacterium]|nr:hypothetical protein [Actinomycetota bacterium]